MRFGTLVLRNLVRQRVRTSLTVLGITIGIATVVALGAITGGLEAALGDFTHSAGADFLVAQKGASDLTFSAVPEADVAAIRRRPDVARADGVAIEYARVGGNPFFAVFGIEPDAQPRMRLTLERGRLVRAPDEIALGSEAAGELDADIGDRVVVERRALRVVGVYRVDDKWRNAGSIATLETVQELTSRPGVVTAAYVTAGAGRDPRAVAAAIERDEPTLVAILDVGDYAEVDQGMKVLDAANLAISLLAVGIGAIGVMNTMIMSVFERTRELGILRAVGWRGSRILRLIVFESLALCLVAAVLGTAVGVAASRAVLAVPSVSSFLVPSYAPEIFVRALAVGIVVALAGAVYPATRAVRLSPMEALRHE